VKLWFDPNQSFQLDAVAAVAEVLYGKRDGKRDVATL
jgi:hypothetical protein